jgi:uncharacterized protein
LIIDLRGLDEGGNTLTFEESPEELHIEDSDLELVGPIRSEVNVYKLGESLSATGHSHFRLRQACVRCLEPFEEDLSAEYTFVLQKGRPNSFSGDEDETLIWLDDEGDQVDLGAEAKDYLLLEIPVKPLCREDCAGLCAVCGANLNQESCSCEVNSTDPRWDALRGLMGQQEGQ